MPTAPKNKKQPRLPSGAHWELSYALVIADDPTKLENAYKYWKKIFSDEDEDKIWKKNNIFSSERSSNNSNVKSGLGKKNIGFPNTPALDISLAIPNFFFMNPDNKNKNLYDLIKQHNIILSGTKSSQDYVLQGPGCLVSAAEIVGKLNAKSLDHVKLDILAFKNAAENPKIKGNETQVARGIWAIREVYDLTRRLIYCQENRTKYLDLKYGSSTSLFAELLALFRQEGALVVTPPAESFEHSPLIQTEIGTCRDPRVTFDPKEMNVDRPYFNLVYMTEAITLKEIYIPEIYIINLAVTGGLDSITKPQLSDQDELVQMLQLYKILKDFSLSEYKFAAAIIMADIEWKENLPSMDKMVEGMIITMKDLNASHPIEFKYPSDVCLVDPKGFSTRNCLKISASWYSSRMKPVTLLPYPQRKDFVNLPRFSSFVTYLRYHMQDNLFLIILVNCVIQIQALSNSPDCLPPKNVARLSDALKKSKWKLYGRDRAKTLSKLKGAYFSAITNRINITKEYQALLLGKLKSRKLDPRLEKLLKLETVKEINNQLKHGKGMLKSIPKSVMDDLEIHLYRHYLWQYKGFIGYLQSKGAASPGLKIEDKINKANANFDPQERKLADAEKRVSEAEQETISRISELAVELVKSIRDMEIMDALCIALEWTTFSGLKKFQIPIGINDWEQMFLKARSFERVKTVYELSLLEAKIDPDTLLN